MEELKRIIDDSEITKEDDALWPPPDRVGRQVRSPTRFPFITYLLNHLLPIPLSLDVRYVYEHPKRKPSSARHIKA